MLLLGRAQRARTSELNANFYILLISKFLPICRRIVSGFFAHAQADWREWLLVVVAVIHEEF